MSRADDPGEQVALGESIQSKAQRARERATAHGARYGRSDDVSERRESQGPQNQCLCGRPIPRDVARVVGDERGVVPACGECARNPGGEPITRTTVAARNWRSERSTVIAERPDGDGGRREVRG